MLKVAVIILIVMLAYGGIYSLMSIIVPTVVMKSALEATISKTLDNARDDGYLKALKGGRRSQGLYALTTTIAGFFVLFAGFRKSQKWAWWAFLVVGGIAWLWGLIYSIAIVDKVNIPFMAIGIVIFLVGLLLPVKEFFVKEAAATGEAEEETKAEEAKGERAEE